MVQQFMQGQREIETDREKKKPTEMPTGGAYFTLCCRDRRAVEGLKQVQARLSGGDDLWISFGSVLEGYVTPCYIIYEITFENENFEHKPRPPDSLYQITHMPG